MPATTVETAHVHQPLSFKDPAQVQEIGKAFVCFLSVCYALRLLIPDMGLEWAPLCAVFVLPAMFLDDGKIEAWEANNAGAFN
jgi:hypothetical protein